MFERTNDGERGQVGIGTLIVFIAMVLVAAIAAGVLINTAGFLQSQSEQTGEESSAQVTNQLQVLSTTGQVTEGSSSAETTVHRVTFDSSDSGSSTLQFVGETTFEASYASNDADSTLTIGDGTGDNLQLTAGNSPSDVTFTPVNESVYEFYSADADDTVVVDLGAGESLQVTSGSGSDTITIGNSLSDTDTNSQTLTSTDTVDTNINLVTAQLEIGGTSTIRVLDGSSISVDTPASSVDVQGEDNSDNIDESFTVNTDNDDFELTVEMINKDGVLNLGSNSDQYRVTGPNGNSITIGDSTNEGLTFSEDVTVSNRGVQSTLSAGSKFDTETLSYVDADNAGSTPMIDSVEVIVTRSPGSSDIDMSQTTISFIAPDGSHDLVYSDGDTPEEDSTFTLSAVQDEDDTLPVLSSGDRFTINIDPGTLEAGTTSELRITTPSGATKSLLVRVPDSLANQEAVGL